jgi:putative salt-induced outer membrane protein YdiY
VTRNRRFFPLLPALLPALLSTLFSGRSAWAQSQAETVRQSAEQTSTTPVREKKAAANAADQRKWTGSMTIGTQIARGATNVNGVSYEGDATYSVPKRTFRIDWSALYADVRPTGSSERVVGQDRDILTATLDQQLRGRFSYLSQLIGEHDRERGLNYRVSSLNGLGVHFQKKRFQMLTAPGIAVTREHKSYVDNRFLLRPGFYEGISYAFSARCIFYEHALYMVDRADGANSSFDGVAQLAAMFNKRLGMQISYNFNYEGRVAPGFNRGLSQVTIGLKVTI